MCGCGKKRGYFGKNSGWLFFGKGPRTKNNTFSIVMCAPGAVVSNRKIPVASQAGSSWSEDLETCVAIPSFRWSFLNPEIDFFALKL